MAKVLIKYQMNGRLCCADPDTKNNGVCQNVHIIPIKTLAINGLNFFSRCGRANPRQPGSSCPPPRKKIKTRNSGYAKNDEVNEKSMET